MAITCEELYKSRTYTEEHNLRSLERIFVVRGTINPTDAKDIGPQLGDEFDDMKAIRRTFNILNVDESNPTDGTLELIVNYERKTGTGGGGSISPEEPEWEWNITSQQEHINIAIAQTHWEPYQDDVGLAINKTVKGEVEGVDILTPKGNFSETHYRDTLSSDYKTILKTLATRVNSAPFKGFAAGEVLFIGANARKRGDHDDWQITYQFLTNPNTVTEYRMEDETGGHTEDIPKQGWEYIWFYLQQEANANRTKIDNKIRSIHVAQVYETANFAQLGIGTEDVD